MFVKAGVVNVDVIDFNELRVGRNRYDIFFIDYEYQYQKKVSEYITDKRDTSFFKRYPLFLLRLSEVSNTLDYDSARSLDVDQVVTGLFSYDQFNALLNRLLKHKLFYENVYSSSGHNVEKFATSVSQYKEKIKSPQLLNLSLLSLYKQQMDSAFLGLFQQHDRALIEPANIIHFSDCCPEPVKSIAALQWLLKNNQLPFRVHTRLAEEYQKLNNIEAIFQHRYIAFDTNPANQEAFVQLVRCLIEQEKLESLPDIMTKRLKYMANKLEDYCQLAIDLSEAFIESGILVSKDQYRLYFEPIVRSLCKRLNVEKRSELTALVNLLKTLHINKAGKGLKARAMALDIYHNDVMRKRKCCLHLNLVALRTLATFGEMKLCIQLVNKLNALELNEKNSELFKWAARPYNKLQKVYLWLKKLPNVAQSEQRKHAAALDSVERYYPYSFDINCLILTALLNVDTADKCQALHVIRRLKRSNYIIRHLALETEIMRSKTYMDTLQNHYMKAV
ncbi:hypothetical protein [Photobacterium satsumensis]|uniref:hypothetical protein n=1 Tax=Photobacterium satsumensis TaxID=2910239 RepID=UPI003D13158D